MKEKSINREVIGLLALSIITYLLYVIFAQLFKHFIEKIAFIEGLSYYIAVAVTLLIIFLLIPKKKLKQLGISKSNNKENMMHIVLLLLIGGFNIIVLFQQGITENILYAFVRGLYAGIVEELILRGYIFSAFEIKFDEYKAIIFSSIVFGLLHLTNLTHNPVMIVLLQVIYTTMFGIGFSILRVRTKSLLMPILIHSFINVTCHLAADISSNITIIDLCCTFCCTFYCLILGICFLYHYRKNVCSA